VASAVPPVLVASGVIPLPPATTTTITATTRHYPIPTASTPTTMRLAQHVSVEPTASYYFPTPPPSATASPASGSARVVTTALPTTLPAPAAAIGRPQMPHPLTMLSLTAAAGAHRPQVPAQSALASQQTMPFPAASTNPGSASPGEARVVTLPPSIATEQLGGLNSFTLSPYLPASTLVAAAPLTSASSTTAVSAPATPSPTSVTYVPHLLS
jgi:hypothetical protein